MWSVWNHRTAPPRDKRDAMPVRIEVCPPATLPESSPWAGRLLAWLGLGRDEARAPDSQSPHPGAAPLDAVRQEFINSLDDVGTDQADDLADRIADSRSLRELWHLRAEVFSVVSCHASQHEARERLTRLNRHFPARAPRSGFGGFDATPQAPVRD